MDKTQLHLEVQQKGISRIKDEARSWAKVLWMALNTDDEDLKNTGVTISVISRELRSSLDKLDFLYED